MRGERKREREGGGEGWSVWGKMLSLKSELLKKEDYFGCLCVLWERKLLNSERECARMREEEREERGEGEREGERERKKRACASSIRFSSSVAFFAANGISSPMGRLPFNDSLSFSLSSTPLPPPPFSTGLGQRSLSPFHLISNVDDDVSSFSSLQNSVVSSVSRNSEAQTKK